VHQSTVHVARTAPDLLDIPEVVQGLEQSLIHAMIECLQPAVAGRTAVSAERRAVTMRRFREAVDEYGDLPLYLPELCVRLGVPARTLRTICHEYLGMGPTKYLLLRRMHLARRALRAGDPAMIHVTDIATQFGFCEFGRFAVNYRALFGESPSTTLRQPSR
jgi:AraC-like DNA-binding protein